MNLAAFKEEGFVLIPQIFDAAARRNLVEPFEFLPASAAGQRLIGDALDELMAASALRPLWPLLQGIIEAPLALRAVPFQKTARANWFVPPHQDRSIPVPNPDSAVYFRNLTPKKEGWRGEAPLSLLRQMCNARVYLDKATEEDGPLEVIPGSHRKGRLSQAGIKALSEGANWKAMTGEAGDLMLLSPLLVHRSRKARHPTGRRVLQIEFLPRLAARVYGLAKV